MRGNVELNIHPEGSNSQWREICFISTDSHIRLGLNGKINTVSINKRAGICVIIANFEPLLVWTTIASLCVCEICANAGFLKQLSSFKQVNTVR